MKVNTPHIEDRTAGDYVCGITCVSLTDDMIANILYKRNIDPCSLIYSLSRKILDLLAADVYIASSMMPSVKTSTEDTDGNWKHKEGGGQITEEDKRRWVSIANRIYSQYGEATYGNGPRVHARGMRIWRKGYDS